MEDSAWKGPPCAWGWRGRAVGECRVWGAAGWKAVAPLDKLSTSSVVFTNYEHISTNGTAATELWGLDITNKQDEILLICAWSVSPLGSCLADSHFAAQLCILTAPAVTSGVDLTQVSLTGTVSIQICLLPFGEEENWFWGSFWLCCSRESIIPLPSFGKSCLVVGRHGETPAVTLPLCLLLFLWCLIWCIFPCQQQGKAGRQGLKGKLWTHLD